MKINTLANLLGFKLETPRILKPQEQDHPVQEQKVAVEQTPKKAPPKKVIYSWRALSRPHKTVLNRKTTKTLMIIGIAVALLLVAMQEFSILLSILGLIFLSYMLSQVHPEELEYKISNNGVDFGDKFYEWEIIKHFFFVRNQAIPVVAIDLIDQIPGRIYLSMRKEDVAKVKEIFEGFIEFLEEEPKTFVDKAYDSLIGGINIDK